MNLYNIVSNNLLNISLNAARRVGWAFGLLAFVITMTGLTRPVSGAQESPQDDIPLAPRLLSANETYRLRVENVVMGSVAISTDGGLHYTLIGRVTHPASAVSLDQTARTPGTVLRSGGDGLAFAVNLGQALKLRPAPTAPINGKRGWTGVPSETSAIVTNLASRADVFGDLLPQVGAVVKMESEGRIQRAFPTPYEPSEEDTYVFLVTLPAPANKGQDGGVAASPEILRPQAVQERMAALGQAYAAQSLARARQEHRGIVSGTLTLKARLPEGEPDPIAFVTYFIDNRQVSTQNVAPFNFEWDTRRVAEGEHMVEVRALNRNGHVITSKRTLVVVQNKPG